jgi:hypothetical protein
MELKLIVRSKKNSKKVNLKIKAKNNAISTAEVIKGILY